MPCTTCRTLKAVNVKGQHPGREGPLLGGAIATGVGSNLGDGDRVGDGAGEGRGGGVCTVIGLN